MKKIEDADREGKRSNGGEEIQRKRGSTTKTTECKI